MDEKDFEKIYNEVSKQPVATDPISKLIEDSYINSRNGPESIVGYNTGIGESQYDEGYNSGFNTPNLNEYRARNQKWYDKTARLLGRATNKVGVEIAKMPGYLAGGAAALMSELATGGEANGMEIFANNAWIQGVQKYEEFINEDVLPVYVKEAVRSGNWWDNISSIDFWATEGADGIGFMLSMLAPGKAIEALKMGSTLLGGLGRTAKGAKMLEKLNKASKTLGLESAASAVDVGTSTLFNTMFEAGSEANSAMEGLEQKEGESDADFQERKGTVGRNVFLSNIGILMGPNLMMNKALFGRLNVDDALKNFATNEGRVINKLAERTTSDKVGDFLKLAGQNILSEGFFEEGMQSTMEEYFKENESIDVNKIMTQYLEMLGTVEGQKAITLGGLFGTGMSGVQSYRQNKAQSTQNDRLSNALNQGIEIYEKSLTGPYKKDDEGNVLMNEETGKPEIDLGGLTDLARAQEILEVQHGALEQAYLEGDLLKAQFINQQLQDQVAITYAKAGDEGIRLLKQQLEQSEAFAKDLDRSNALREENQESIISKEKAIADIVSNAEQIKNDNELLMNYGNTIIKPKVNNDNVKYLDQFRDRISNAYIKDQSKVRFLTKKQKELESNKQASLSSLSESLDADIETLETHPIIRAINNDIKQITDYKNEIKENLNSLLTSKNINEKFKEFVNDRQNLEQAEELLKEEEENQREEEEEIATAEEVENTHAVETEEKDTLNEAKEEASKAYTDIENFLDDLSVNSGGKKGQIDELQLQHITNLPGLQNVIPELPDNSENIQVTKIKDDEGRDAYLVETSNNNFKMMFPKYNVPSELEKNSSTQVISDDITNGDQSYTSQDNQTESQRAEANSVQSETGEKGSSKTYENKKKVSKKHVKLVESNDPNITSQNYKTFRESPRDKTGEKASFRLGDPGTNEKAKEAIKLYNEYIYDGKELTKQNKKDLLNYLPIRVTFNDDVYTQLFFKSDASNATDLSSKELDLRTNILTEAIKNRVPLENISSSIQFQFPGKIQNEVDENGLPSKNSVLELPQINNNLDNVDLVYVDNNGVYRNTSKGEDLDLSTYKSNSLNKGSIFLKLKAANGKIIPIKLNLRRIDLAEAGAILSVVEKLLDPKVKIGYKTKMSTIEEFEDVLDAHEEDIKAFGSTKKNITVGQFMSNMIFEGNTGKNKFKISGQTLTYGTNKVNFAEFKAKKHEIQEWVSNNKNRNIKISKLSTNAYKKHIIESGILTTDIKLGEPSFQENTAIYIDSKVEVTQSITTSETTNQSQIDNINKNVIKESENTLKTEENFVSSQEEKSKKNIENKKKASKKRKGSAYKNAMNKINSAKKDDDKNSNTIC